MKILFVYKEDYPWDVRVEKIVTTLASADNEVTLLANNRCGLPCRENASGFVIHRLPAMPRIFGRPSSFLGAPVFFNPIWLRAISQTLDETCAQLVLVRDLPLMLGVTLMARRRGVPVVFDMAECYPEMYSSMLEFNANRSVQQFFKNPWVTAQIERAAIRHADHTLVMIEESRDRLLKLGADPARVSIVSNTPPLSAQPVREHREDPVLRLLYVGFVTRIRGLSNLLHGIRVFADRGNTLPRAEVDVVGIGHALPEYRELAAELGLSQQVRFHGWCEQEFVDSLYANADVGVLTYHVCGHWNHTIPNKLFDYMRSGIPVLATDVLPVKRIIEEEGCGVIFPDRDAVACAEALTQLSDPAVRAKLGHCGRAAVERRYNWEVDADRLREVVASFA